MSELGTRRENVQTAFTTRTMATRSVHQMAERDE